LKCNVRIGTKYAIYPKIYIYIDRFMTKFILRWYVMISVNKSDFNSRPI